MDISTYINVICIVRENTIGNIFALLVHRSKANFCLSPGLAKDLKKVIDNLPDQAIFRRGEIHKSKFYESLRLFKDLIFSNLRFSWFRLWVSYLRLRGRANGVSFLLPLFIFTVNICFLFHFYWCLLFE